MKIDIVVRYWIVYLIINITYQIIFQETEMRYQYRDATKTGALIGAGTPDRTSLAQANENRIKLGLPPFKSKFDEVITKVAYLTRY